MLAATAKLGQRADTTSKGVAAFGKPSFVNWSFQPGAFLGLCFALEVPMLSRLRAALRSNDRLHRWDPRALICTAALLAFTASPAGAQSATGSIEGLIVDQSGAVLPGVTVTVTLPATGATRTVVTDEQGLFRAPLLPPGAYDVNAELAGFTTRRQSSLALTIGQTLTLRIQMALATLAENVVVSATAPVIETGRTQVSSTVDEAAVQNLPVNGRNFIDFALLTPGVTKDVRTGDISFAGQRGTLNSLVVDGADNNNTFFGQALGRTGSGRAPYQFSQDAVREFQVNSNSYSAEYGRAGGAVINVVTKSGTNDLHGSGFWFVRDEAMNANNAINVLRGLPKSPYHFDQFGGTLGGPIQPDRHFYFFNYDGQRNETPNAVFLNVPAGTPNDPATQAAIARLQPLAVSWAQKFDQDVFLIKTDSQLAPSQRLTLRYNHQNFKGQNLESGGPQNSIEHTGASNVFTRSFNVTFASVFGTALFNEARVQIAKDREPGEANSANPEAAINQGTARVLTIGRNFFSPRETTIERWQVADTLTWVRGAHKLKGGFDFQFDDILNFFPGNFSGSYTFNTLASFQGGRPTGAGERYVQAFAGDGTTGPTTRPNIEEYSFFVLDEWKLRPDLTFNAGLRYDLQKFAQPPVSNPNAQLAAAGIDTSVLNTDANNWGPRLGLAWSPPGARYVVRGGYGFFYGRTPSIMVGTAHSNNGINVQTITFTGNLVPTYPEAFSQLPSGVTLPRPTIFTFDSDYENARLQQASLAGELEILPNTSLAVTYLFVKGSQLPRSTDINIGPASPITFTVEGTGETLPHYRFAAGPFTDFARVISFQGTAESLYNGVTFELNRRFTGGLQARVAYTLGKVEDTVPDATAVVPQGSDDAKFASNPSDFEEDRARGNNDQRHRLVASAIWTSDGLVEGKDSLAAALVRGWTVSGIFTAQSGQPYSAYVNTDINLDGNTRNDIAPGTRRNQYGLDTQITLDPRVTRDIRFGRTKVQLIVEAFNLLNRDNISAVNTTRYTVTGLVLRSGTTFEQPLASSGPRIGQVAVKVIF
jgi:outer membrane receptor protein involved in Fe transport